MSLRLKIMMFMGIVVTLTAIYVTFFWLPKSQQVSKDNLSRTTHKELLIIADGLVVPLLQNELSVIHENLDILQDRFPEWIRLELYDPDQTLLYPLLKTPPTEKTDHHHFFRHPIMIRGDVIGELQVTVDFAPQLNILRDQTNGLFWLLALSLTLALIGIFLFIDYFIRKPVRDLARAAEELAIDNFSAALPKSRGDEIGSLIETFASMRTKIQSSAEKLQQNEQQLRDFGASASDWYWEMDKDLRFSYFSENFTSITGVAQKTLLGKTRQENGNPGTDSAQWQEHLDNLSNHRAFRNFAHPRVKADGSTVWLAINGKPVLDEQGRFQGYRGTGLDITKSRQAQLELVQAKEEAEKANRAKSEFLSSMSHELRTPLNAIFGFGQMLAFNPKEPLTKTQKFSVSHINKGSTHLLALINDILDLAKIEAGKIDMSIEHIRPKDLFDECRELVTGTAADKRISLTGNYDSDYGLQADYVRLKQVLLNLFSNAIKYNKHDGSITYGYKELPGGWMRLYISDTGSGLDAAKMSNLFQPFNRLGMENSDIEGTGIGLAISRNLVERMGGKIGCESEEGVGSTFWVDLKRGEKHPDHSRVKLNGQSRDVAPIEPETAALTGSILYVEDNPANLELMELIIGQASDFLMLSAHNAELGIEIARAKQPQVIIMDINLPGMDGFEALTALKQDEKTHHIPVIALSANALPNDIARGKQSGFYIT